MSLQTSRYESQNVVNSFNLFIDTERSSIVGHSQNKGDDLHIHFEANSIEAMDGEIIRLSLTNFTMFNNLYMVDATNCRVEVKTTPPTTTSDALLRLTKGNYGDYHDVAIDFSNVLGTHLRAEALAIDSTSSIAIFDPGTHSTVKPNSGYDNNRLLEFTLTAKDAQGTAVAHGLTEVLIQCHLEYGDSYAILGGEAIHGPHPSTTGQSFEVTTGTTTVTVKGYFPMQRMSDPYVYLRCGSTSNGLQMSVLDSAFGASTGGDVANSNILGKMFRDVEFIQYHAQSDEYFVNLQQRRLSHLHLFLTDSKGRRLGRMKDDFTGTAAGRESGSGDTLGHVKDNQNTLGNLFFTAVVKIEVIKVRNPKHLETKPLPAPMPAREAQSVVVWPDYGRPKY